MLHISRTFGLLILLFGILSLSVLAQESPDAEAHLSRGEAYLQNNNYKEAIAEFKEAIRIKPKWADAYFKLGLAYSAVPIGDNSLGDTHMAAMKAFKDTVRLKPEWAEAHRELGSKYTTLQQLDKAISSLKEAIRLKPELADAHEQLSIAYLYQSQYSDAIESLKQAVRLQPGWALAHRLLGLAYLAVDDREKALEEYAILKRLDQEMAGYLNNKIQAGERPTFGVSRGKAISIPQPEYPAAARSSRVSGSVTVDIVIDENGKVISANAKNGPSELRGAAETAAMKARFEPTKLSGMPVKVNGVITYRFSP